MIDRLQLEIDENNRLLPFVCKFSEEARAFRDELMQERQKIENLRRVLGGFADESWLPQIEELEQDFAILKRLTEAADYIVKRNANDVINSQGAFDKVAALEKAVSEVVAATVTHRFHRLPVIGPLIANVVEPIRIRRCQGRHADAYFATAQHFNDLARDSDLPPFWRFRKPGDPNAVWLYFHNRTEKYKCLFFRVGVNRSGSSVSLSLETYVPFGSFGDRAQYKNGESQVYRRPGWITVDVSTDSLSVTDAINKSLTTTANYQRSLTLANTETDTTGTTITDSVNTSDTYSTSASRSLTGSSSTSWVDGWNSTRGWQWTQTDGNSTTDTTGTSHARAISRQNALSESDNHSVGKTIQAGSTYGLSIGSCLGINHAIGRSMQTSSHHYGIDLGESFKVHFEQWKSYHPDEARIFDLIVEGFTELGEQLKDRFQLESSFDGSATTTLKEREAELQQLLLCEDLWGRTTLLALAGT